MSRKSVQIIHEGAFAAEVDVQLIDDGTDWGPYLSLDDMGKLDRVRLSLRADDVRSASQEARVFQLVPVSADETPRAPATSESNSFRKAGFQEQDQRGYESAMAATGIIRAGIGGWTFEPWRGTFFPEKLAHAKELGFASRQLATIEVNGTYYRSQTPATFAKWAGEVPDGFVFALKAPRFATNRKVLGEAGDSVQRFIDSGIAELGDRLGPLLWQFANTKQFDSRDFGAFLALLPAEAAGIPLHHVVEVRHPSFAVPEFIALARQKGVAIVHAEHATYPEIADVTGSIVYSRLQKGVDSEPTAYPPDALDAWARRATIWAEGGVPDDLPLISPDDKPAAVKRDVFVYFIHEGKVRAPQAAQALQKRVPSKAQPKVAP